MDEHIKQIRAGWSRFRNSSIVKENLGRVQKGITYIWLGVGMIPGWVLMSLLLIYSSLWDVYVIASGEDIASGMDIITHNQNIQLVIALLVLTFGVVLAMARNQYLLTIGAVLVIIYAGYLGAGVLQGVLSIRGWRGVMYLITAAGGVLIASYSSWLYTQQTEELLKQKAEMDAQRIVVREINDKNKQLATQVRDLQSVMETLKHGTGELVSPTNSQ